MRLSSLVRCASGLLASTALASAALAQTAPEPPLHKNVDENGVDLTDGSFNFTLVEGSAGSGAALLPLIRYYGAAGQRDNVSVSFRRSGTIILRFGDRREEFPIPATGATTGSLQGTGAVLTKISASEYKLTEADGSVTKYGPPDANYVQELNQYGFCGSPDETDCELVAVDTVRPDGSTLTYNWYVTQACKNVWDPAWGEWVIQCKMHWRQTGVTNSYGYKITFSFASSTLGTVEWSKRTGATLSNTVTGATVGTISYATPATGVTDVTDMGGNVWRFTESSGKLTAIRRPGSSSDNVSVVHGTSGSPRSRPTV